MDILIYGFINSVALALMALGFALVYGISRVPNFAHGALYVVSGFLTWTLLRSAGLNYLVSVILAMVITGVIGALIYQFILIRVRGFSDGLDVLFGTKQSLMAEHHLAFVVKVHIVQVVTDFVEVYPAQLLVELGLAGVVLDGLVAQESYAAIDP